MNTKKLALITILSAVTITVAYARGLGLTALPGVFEFITVLIFVSGFSFGRVVGSSVGFISLVIYMLIPYPFAHPAAWLLTTVSPLLLIIMGLLGTLFGLVGGVLGEIMNPEKINIKFIVSLAMVGFSLTLAYDVFSSIGFYLAYPVYSSVWEAIYLTFIPLYYPYPPIIHTATNTIIFATVAPPLIHALRNFQI